jgi:hypothetical protein
LHVAFGYAFLGYGRSLPAIKRLALVWHAGSELQLLEGAMANFIRGGSRIYGTAPSAPPSAATVRLRQLGHNDLAATVESTLRAAPPAPPEDSPKPPAKGDNYLSALLKLVPAEIITVYLATKDTASAHQGLTTWFILCLITCIIFRAYSNLPDKAGAAFKDVQWRAVLVSAAAFFLWAFATAEQGKPPIAGLNLEPWLAGAAAGLFGILAPVLVPADPQTEAGNSHA